MHTGGGGGERPCIVLTTYLQLHLLFAYALPVPNYLPTCQLLLLKRMKETTDPLTRYLLGTHLRRV